MVLKKTANGIEQITGCDLLRATMNAIYGIVACFLASFDHRSNRNAMKNA